MIFKASFDRLEQLSIKIDRLMLAVAANSLHLVRATSAAVAAAAAAVK